MNARVNRTQCGFRGYGLGLIVAAAGVVRAAPDAAAPPSLGAATAAVAVSSDAPAPLDAFLAARHPGYVAALVRARAWLERLEVDPIVLRAQGIKGKKKLAELLDALLRLHAVVAAPERATLAARIRDLAAQTATPAYHDLLRLDDRQFKEDATSYLRVAFLLDRFGLDTAVYRREIARVLPRLNAHMPSRGVDQRMTFHLYYRHFGLPEPFPLAVAFRAGLIATRRPAAYFLRDRMQIYNLTHEIFAPYEFGENLEANFFSDADKAYLRPLLAELTAASLARDDADLVAELASCLRYLRLSDEPVYREAVAYLLRSQWPDGKWGRYEQLRPHYGNFVDQGFYLHTTLVALDALITAFGRPAAAASR